MIWSDHLIKPNQNRMPHSKLRNINRGNGNAVPCVRCARSPVLDHLAFIYLIFFSFGAAIRFLYYCLYAHTLAISGNLESYNVNHYLKCPRATHMHGGEKKKCLFYREKKSNEQEWKFVCAHCFIAIKWSDCVTEGNGSRQQQPASQHNSSDGISK